MHNGSTTQFVSRTSRRFMMPLSFNGPRCESEWQSKKDVQESLQCESEGQAYILLCMYIQVDAMLCDVMCICSVSIFANSRAKGNTDQGGVEPPQSCCQSCKLCESNATPKGQLVLCMLFCSCGSNGQLCFERAKSPPSRNSETNK